jgi:hypothetical protein
MRAGPAMRRDGSVRATPHMSTPNSAAGPAAAAAVRASVDPRRALACRMAEPSAWNRLHASGQLRKRLDTIRNATAP